MFAKQSRVHAAAPAAARRQYDADFVQLSGMRRLKLQAVFDRGISRVLSFAHISYNTIVVKCTEVFFCFEAADGISYLAASPEIVCKSPTHVALQIFGALGIVVYVVGLPAFLGWILYVGRTRGYLSRPRYVARYGFFYRRYETRFVYWGLVLILRRFAFSLVMVCVRFLMG
jgi:hypothetical protein